MFKDLELFQFLLKEESRGPRFPLRPLPNKWDQNLDINLWWEKLREAESFHLYLHLPFCEALCTFCGLNIYITKDQSVIEQYMTALIKEYKTIREMVPNFKIKTITIGGGTPSYLAPSDLDALLGEILRDHQIEGGRFEAASRSLKEDHLKVIKQFGINQVSLGVQDMNPKILTPFGRHQSEEDVKKSFERVRKYGLELAIDLIHGLPGQDPKAITNSFGQLESVRPESISFYPLAVAPWQKAHQMARGYFKLPTPEEKLELYFTGKEFLEKWGYSHLGFNHFASPEGLWHHSFLKGDLHRNMSGYTSFKTDALVGLGVSSISHLNGAIKQNQKLLNNYLADINSRGYSLFKSHVQSELEIEEQNEALELATDPQRIEQNKRDLLPYYLNQMAKSKLALSGNA